jgi:FKBP-type peptidyl-prolyl cis-trans isomerase
MSHQTNRTEQTTRRTSQSNTRAHKPTIKMSFAPVPGYATTMRCVRQGTGAVVAKGDSVTVHAKGVVRETDKTFWSTKDPGQKPFTYTAGVGGVITGTRRRRRA